MHEDVEQWTLSHTLRGMQTGIITGENSWILSRTNKIHIPSCPSDSILGLVPGHTLDLVQPDTRRRAFAPARLMLNNPWCTSIAEQIRKLQKIQIMKYYTAMIMEQAAAWLKVTNIIWSDRIKLWRGIYQIIPLIKGGKQAKVRNGYTGRKAKVKPGRCFHNVMRCSGNQEKETR